LNGSLENTASGVWKNLEKHFSNIGVDNTRQIDPNRVGHLTPLIST
jgi:hypothetical protein